MDDTGIFEDMETICQDLIFSPHKGGCANCGKFFSIMVTSRQVASLRTYVDIKVHVDLIAPSLETEPEIIEGVRQSSEELLHHERRVIRQRAEETLQMLKKPRLSEAVLKGQCFILKGVVHGDEILVITSDEGVGTGKNLSVGQDYIVLYKRTEKLRDHK